MSQPTILELVAQLDALQQRVAPLLPMVSQKLVADLLSDGTSPRSLAKTIGRSPGFIRAVAGGGKSLSANQIVKIAKHVAEGQKNANQQQS